MSVLAPEARRWLDSRLPPGARVTVAGVAGGVGVTTVTGLLWWALTTYGDHAVKLVDHGGGSLHARLPVAAPTRTPDLTLHDAGAVALTALRDHAPLVLVCGAHEAGLRDVATSLKQYATGPDDAWHRCVVVPVATTGTGLTGTELRRRADALGIPAALVPVRRSAPLAAGGDIPAPGASRTLADAHRSGVAIAAEALRCLTTGMGTTTHPKRP
ncbi:hypothetical protein V2J52_03220 [Georgenia sp. MJ173]|uniref:hypothetical protein n=1 Tax=Georgenia sunbinii TaxID=3117728 RepID=UPI002F262F6F